MEADKGWLSNAGPQAYESLLEQDTQYPLLRQED